MSGIKLFADFRSLDREFDRLEKLPDARTAALLGLVLQDAFAETQGAVHIDTGSLKASGKAEDDKDRFRNNWEGTITYGGPSTGVNNPVDYAIYEKARGGAHNFMANLSLMDSLFVTAMKEGLRG